MEPRKFRKLHVNLPRQPLVNQRPWLIAGYVFAAAFLLLAVLLYLSK
jgi:hypothetical protein